ncbi:hypothetical protein LTR91_010120 [Friedmanniomyces endolithicus]|uniref:Uncharacterized protein n=1 Tax=Friedmanniomyces endolithicus TaxID=329885 RepID=A0AAN6KK35_9PEZI|nr:hypothetical protein LTR94_019130 [Friedmanniomyces endolithicus]KAK0769483.1 hypothetical protein LTR59_017003 [Friedmanniomyces endolithicus]KAK0786161.1 hypothetical protein LTR38_012113 [Friedmanniomyces endolithicus]KAK0790118.1 hypothetical protein LTR75_012139 [Friedmanniomyces endolithicus]KAK0854405.1 hypothetical protein LTR03_002436 [Friedmanniomyces endolithicus]
MPPKVSWLVPRPKKKRYQELAVFCEAVAQHSASKLGYDKVEIRAMPHETTMRDGVLLRIQNHLTLNWLDLVDKDQNKYEMKKAGELFVDKGNTRSLTSDELDENTRKLNKSADNVNDNPHTW